MKQVCRYKGNNRNEPRNKSGFFFCCMPAKNTMPETVTKGEKNLRQLPRKTPKSLLHTIGRLHPVHFCESNCDSWHLSEACLSRRAHAQLHQPRGLIGCYRCCITHDPPLKPHLTAVPVPTYVGTCWLSTSLGQDIWQTTRLCAVRLRFTRTLLGWTWPEDNAEPQALHVKTQNRRYLIVRFSPYYFLQILGSYLHKF